MSSADETDTVDLDEHHDLVRVIAGDHPTTTTLRYQDGVLLRRLPLDGNYWQLVVDEETVTCFDGDQAQSTTVLKQQIEKLISLHREEDDYSSTAYH